MKEKTTFKVFKGSYLPDSGHGGCYYYDIIVIAEEESVALDLSLEKYPKTIAKNWIFEEIILDERKIIQINVEEY